MKKDDAPIAINVDPTNPGQFFACCGLLELADRLWPGAEGWFANREFCIQRCGSIQALLSEFGNAEFQQVDPDNDTSSPVALGKPFNLLLDWWTDEIASGQELKVWAGSMRSTRIARAMKHAIVSQKPVNKMFSFGDVVYDPGNPKKKVEPFYFDSRRGASAKSLDIGFAPDVLKMTTVAHPGVEIFCLIGLQRFRPKPTTERRHFEYATWSRPLPPVVAAAACCGQLQYSEAETFRFENAFRTDQRKHKSFLPAKKIGTLNGQKTRTV